MCYLKMLSLTLNVSCIIFKSLRLKTRVWYFFWVTSAILCLYLEYDIFFVSPVWYSFCVLSVIYICCVSSVILFQSMLWVIKCYKHAQNLFKRDEFQIRFKIFLSSYRLFTTIKILVILLVTDLTNNTKN